jgi:hypothetical protein
MTPETAERIAAMVFGGLVGLFVVCLGELYLALRSRKPRPLRRLRLKIYLEPRVERGLLPSCFVAATLRGWKP